MTAGIYIQASPLTLWDWKSEGARESDSEGTGSDGSATQKHHTVTAELYTQASPLTLWDCKSEGARESDSEGTGSDGSATQKHHTVTAELYTQASPLTLWDWKSEGARESDSEGTGSDGSTTQKHHTVTAELYHKHHSSHCGTGRARGARELAVTAAGLYTQASQLTVTVGLEERGGRGNSDSEGTGSDGSTTHKHHKSHCRRRIPYSKAINTEQLNCVCAINSSHRNSAQ